MMILSKINEEIKKNDFIAIFPHISIDGDSFGSSLALAIALNELGKNVDIVIEEDIPKMFKFLPGIDYIKQFTGREKNYKLSIALDCGDMGRLGSRADLFGSSPLTINIDHHSTNTEYGFYNVINAKAAACGEIVYQLIKLLGVEFNRDIAACLYVAIATDTGGFKFSNTTSITHHITAELINYGIDIVSISKHVFDVTSLEKLRLTALAIESLEMYYNGRVSVIVIDNDTIKKSGAKDEDGDGIVNIGRNIEGVEVAVVLRRLESGEIKINLRSNYYVDVSSIANLFNGGGHKRAAGALVKGDIVLLKEQVLADIKEVL
jgi:bifunctional oligoribonuclease and PAP phosphatase NrnA